MIKLFFSYMRRLRGRSRERKREAPNRSKRAEVQRQNNDLQYQKRYEPSFPLLISDCEQVVLAAPHASPKHVLFLQFQISVVLWKRLMYSFCNVALYHIILIYNFCLRFINGSVQFTCWFVWFCISNDNASLLFC